jgi:hypothetical protein
LIFKSSNDDIQNMLHGADVPLSFKEQFALGNYSIIFAP